MSKKFYLLILTAFFLALFLCFPLERNSVKTQKRELLKRASYTEAENSGLVLSKEPGFYEKGFDLKIFYRGPHPGGKIYYTLDGSIPTESSALYKEPLHLTDPTPNPNLYASRDDVSAGLQKEKLREAGAIDPPLYAVPSFPVDKCVVIRAVYYKAKGEPAEVETASYFIGYRNRPGYQNLPVVSLVSDPTYLFDPDYGIYVLGSDFDRFVSEGMPETKKLWFFWAANYFRYGRESEREASVNFFDADHRFLCNQNIGIRIQGHASRSNNPKSLNLYARKSYDGNSSFQCRLENLPYPEKRLNLFSGGSDQDTLFRDYLAMHFGEKENFSTMRFSPCLLFLNGEYWGFYQMAERYDALYFAHHYRVNPDNVVYIKEGEVNLGLSSDLALYEELQKWISENDMTVPENYNKACEKIDMDSLLSYYAFEIYIANGDWPFSNVGLWRTRETGKGKYEDGRWRYVLFDVNGECMAESKIRDNTLQTAIDHDAIFGSLCNNKEFQQAFLEKLQTLATSTFSKEQVEPFIRNYLQTYTKPMQVHRKRFFEGSPDPFAKEMQGIQRFFEERASYLIPVARKTFG